MHRSGTSMLSRLLNIAGIYLGDEDEILRIRADNPKGHWEHKGFLDFNERILSLFGADWTCAPLYPTHWLDLADVQALQEEARAFVAQTFADKPSWGWKEPRTTLTIPFWRQTVPDLRFVICIRNPLDVAASLHTRDEFPVSLGTTIWHVYTVIALQETKPEERIFAFYNDFFSDYRAALAPILDFLKLPLIEAGSAQEQEIASFIDAGLNHHRHSLEDVLDSAEVPSATQQLYETLVRSPEEAAALCRTAEAEAFQQQLQEFLWLEYNKRRAAEEKRLRAEVEHCHSVLPQKIGELQAVLNLPSHRVADSLSRSLHRLLMFSKRRRFQDDGDKLSGQTLKDE
jgi:hypothetical protein